MRYSSKMWANIWKPMYYLRRKRYRGKRGWKKKHQQYCSKQHRGQHWVIRLEIQNGRCSIFGAVLSIFFSVLFTQSFFYSRTNENVCCLCLVVGVIQTHVWCHIFRLFSMWKRVKKKTNGAHTHTNDKYWHAAGNYIVIFAFDLTLFALLVLKWFHSNILLCNFILCFCFFRSLGLINIYHCKFSLKCENEQFPVKMQIRKKN